MTAPAPVDVRAVLAELRSFMASSYPEYDSAQKLDAADAAVAELIEAAKDLDATYGWVWDRDDGAIFIMPHRVTEFDRRSARLSAALARFRGAQ